MTGEYITDDPRLRPPHPSRYPWIPLPEPESGNAVVSVSLLDSSTLVGPADAMSSFAPPGEKWEVPSWSFLIEHRDEAMLFDLGLRQDLENFTPAVKPALDTWRAIPHPHPVTHLQEGGYDLSRISTLVISHKHFDHFGDLSTVAPFDPLVVVGPGTLDFIGKGYPEDKGSSWPSEWLAERRIHELSVPPKDAGSGVKWDVPGREGSRTKTWEPVGCFEAAVDWFGDGSFHLVYAPGHTSGQMMGLARVTASPPTYILLAADVAHSQDTYLPVPSGAEGEADPRGTEPVKEGKTGLLDDPARGVRDIGALTRMSAEDNVMVLLAHEAPASEVLPRWPEALDRWKNQGWKERKEEGVKQRATERGCVV